MQLPIYLDYNSTTPCDPRVVEEMLPYFTTSFGNAASKTHSFGWQAEEAVEYAREKVAMLIGAEAKEVVFTSGATEGVNLALKGVVEVYASKGNHIIISNIEHKAVLDSCKNLEKRGVEVTYLEADKDGLILPQQVEDAIQPNTVLISVMYANNEVGTINAVKEIGAVARKHGVLFFTDATQAVGKIPVNVNSDNIDIMAFSSHKIYGPKGVGALFARRRNPRVRVVEQINGGGHERGMRSGTLNVPGIVGFGKAAEICGNEMKKDAERLGALRDRLEQALLEAGDVFVNGSKVCRLPNVTNLSFKGVEGQALMMSINKEIAVSSGSACTSASLEPSYVLKALGLDDELAHSSIRFSLGRFTTTEEIEYAIEQVRKNTRQLREMNLFGSYNN
ncbi:MAG: IscS subfamily cysteine desulfurase [Flavisolibacter sp.]